MKHVPLCISLLFSGYCSSQWISIPKNTSYIVPPNNQFMVNPYTNDLWFVRDQDASVIQNDGTVIVFDTNDLGMLWGGDKLRFAFTPSHTYFSKDQVGLYTFDNFIKQPLWSDQEITDLTIDGDTLFIVRNGNYYTYSISQGINNSQQNCIDLKSRNGFLYFSLGSLAHNNGGTVQNFWADPHYLLSPMNYFSFSRNTDTLFVASEKGISVAYNYDFYDTITPNNTANMPSANVLEMRFDLNDSLWAIFGNPSGTPIGLAKLEGTAWTNIYDSNNSPINFSQYKGFDFDTLGNLWLVDGSFLHTLSSSNNPGWLSTIEHSAASSFSIYPNPSVDHFSLQIPEQWKPTHINVTDLAGKLVLQQEYKTAIQHELKSGVYIIELWEADLLLGKQKIVVRY